MPTEVTEFCRGHKQGHKNEARKEHANIFTVPHLPTNVHRGRPWSKGQKPARKATLFLDPFSPPTEVHRKQRPHRSAGPEVPRSTCPRTLCPKAPMSQGPRVLKVQRSNEARGLKTKTSTNQGPKNLKTPSEDLKRICLI